MKHRTAPRSAYVAALACSCAALAAIPVLLVGLDLERRFSWVLALGGCGLLGLAFAYVWPAPSWRWGLWVSSGFWLFFGLVSVSLLARGQAEWAPAFDALLVAAVGCAGAVAGRWLAGRTRRDLRQGA